MTTKLRLMTLLLCAFFMLSSALQAKEKAKKAKKAPPAKPAAAEPAQTQEKPAIEPPPNPQDDIFNPSKLKECHAQGFVYDRVRRDCIQVQYIPYKDSWCTTAGIKKVFSKIPGAEDMIDQLLSQLFDIDQCGKSPIAGPLVILLLKDETNKRFEQRKICLQDSPLCK